MMNPVISVIMLVHNRERFVSQAVESILAQDLSDFEFIIVDNKSTDNSGAIIANYAKQDPRIKIFCRNDENIGTGRNLGIEKSCGKYFTFIDDDDYVTTDYLSFLHSLAEDHNADIAVCGSSYDINGEIKPKFVFNELVLCNREQAVTNFLLRRYYNSGNATKLFRNNGEIARIRYSERGSYDDIHTIYQFFAAVGEQCAAVAAKGEAKYIVRRHAANNSEATTDFLKLTPECLTEYLCAYRERTVYISRKIPNLSGLAEWSEWSFMISMVEKINRFKIVACSEYLKVMRTELHQHFNEFMNAEWTQDFEKKWMEKFVE